MDSLVSAKEMSAKETICQVKYWLSGGKMLSKFTILSPTPNQMSTSPSSPHPSTLPPKLASLSVGFLHLPPPNNWTFSWRTYTFWVVFHLGILNYTRPSLETDLLMKKLGICVGFKFSFLNPSPSPPPPPRHAQIRPSNGELSHFV